MAHDLEHHYDDLPATPVGVGQGQHLSVQDNIHRLIADNQTAATVTTEPYLPALKINQKQTGTQANNASAPDVLSATKDFAVGFGQSLAHTVVQNPLESVAQIFDHTAGKVISFNLFAKSKDLLFSAPKDAAEGSASWYGQTLGGALGVIPLVISSRAGARLVIPELETIAGSKLLSFNNVKSVLNTAATGAYFGTVFQPASESNSTVKSTSQDNFFAAKAGIVARDAITFGALRASTLAFETAVSGSASMLRDGSSAAARVTPRSVSAVAGGLSGLSAAGVNASMDYAMPNGQGHEALTAGDFAKNALAYGAIGAVLGGLGGSPKALVKTSETTQKPVADFVTDARTTREGSVPVEAPKKLPQAPDVITALDKPAPAGPPWSPRRAVQHLDRIDIQQRIDTPDLPNFAAVSAKSWRAGQFTDRGLEQLASLGARTIVNLQPEEYYDEPVHARELGLNYFHEPINENLPISRATADRLIAIGNDADNYPIVWHCWYGQDRTGAAMALVRTALGEKTAQEALKEMDDFGVHDKHKIFADSVRSFLLDKPQ